MDTSAGSLGQPESAYAEFPPHYPKEMPDRCAVVARGLNGTLGFLHISASHSINASDRDRISVHFRNLNRDLRELELLLPTGYDEAISQKYPPTGVMVGDRRGTCYAEVVLILATNLRSKIFSENGTLAENFLNGTMAINPDSIGNLVGLAKWAQTITQDDFDALEIALLNEHRLAKRVFVTPTQTELETPKAEKLSPAEADILQALLEAGGPLKQDELAKRATGKSVADGKFKGDCATLVRREMITSGAGAGSAGYSITAKGIVSLEKHLENCQDNSKQ